MIYSRTLVKESAYNEKSAITLMSTDIDRITFSLIRVTDLWAQFTEVAIGTGLLWRQLGPIAIAPIVIVLVSFFVQSWASKFMGATQALLV
jgi:hypothetical protein